MSVIMLAIAPLAATIQAINTQLTEQSTILAELTGFKGQIDDLKMDVNNHEQLLTHLNSKLHKQDALLTVYKTTNDRIVTSLRTDVNDTRAKIPELCRELMDSTVGLATSIKEIEALVHDLRQQQQQEPVHRETTPTTPPPVWGASVDPPPTLGTSRLNLPGGLNPTFQGATSFPSGNPPHCDTDAPPDPGAHQDNHSMGRTPAPATPSPASQEALRWDPSAIDLASLSGGNPPPDSPHVTFDTPGCAGAQVDGSNVLIVGRAVTLPQPSNKERLARSRGIGLFDIAGLATVGYHGGSQGIQDPTVLFIHNCGYQTFSNTVSPEDILLCFSKIQQLHRKVLQSWFNPRTQVSGPSLECLLDRGLKAFPQLRSMNMDDAVKFYNKFQELSHAYLLPLMPFDATRLGNNFEGLFVPGLGTQRYH